MPWYWPFTVTGTHPHGVALLYQQWIAWHFHVLLAPRQAMVA